MPTYVVAHLQNVVMGEEIAEYLMKVDDTFKPYGGRFLVHGATAETVEGRWPGSIVIVEFPDREKARAWYASDAYQSILRLRTNNSDGHVIFVDGVPEGYRARDLLKA
jgi:uncharacterized protein (DUF1330 family)